MTKSDAYEADILRASVGLATTVLSTTPLTNIWMALYTAAPSDTGGGTEVTGGSYARVNVAGSSFWTAVSGTSPTQIANTAAINFPTATADWGTVTHMGLLTASSGGTLLRWAALTASKVVQNGDTLSFAIGALVLTED